MKRTYRTMTSVETFRAMTDADKQKLTRSLLRTYEAHSGADMVCVGFEYKKHCYYTLTDKLLPRWCWVEQESSKKGGKVKVQLRLNNPDMEELLRTHECVEFDPAVLLTFPRNRGNSFEKFVTETLTGEKWKKDSVPFYKQGDVVLNGKQVQVKFNGAQGVMESTLCARPWAC